jgi:hypothetical protein
LGNQKERISCSKDKVEELLHSEKNKEKETSHSHNIEELWDKIKIPNL